MVLLPFDPITFISNPTETVYGNEGYFAGAAWQWWVHGTRITVAVSPTVSFVLGVKKEATPVSDVDGQIDGYGKPNTSNSFIAEFCIAANALPWPEGVEYNAYVDTDRPDPNPPAFGQRAYAIMKSAVNADGIQSHNNPNQAAGTISMMAKQAVRGGSDMAVPIAACIAEAAQWGPGARVKMTQGRWRIASDAGLYVTGGQRDLFLDVDFSYSLFGMDGGQFQTGGGVGRMIVRRGVQQGRALYSHDGTFAFRLGGYSTAGLITLKDWSINYWQDGPTLGVVNKPGSALLVDGGHAEVDNVSLLGCTAKRQVVSFHNIKNVVGRRILCYDDSVIDSLGHKKNGAERGWLGIGGGADNDEAGTGQGVIRLEDCWFDENYGIGQSTYYGGIEIDPYLPAPGNMPHTTARMRHVELVNCQGRLTVLNDGSHLGCGVLARHVDSLEIRGGMFQRQAGSGLHALAFEDVRSMRVIGCRGNPLPEGDDVLFLGDGAGKTYYERGCSMRARILAPGATWPDVMDVG